MIKFKDRFYIWGYPTRWYNIGFAICDGQYDKYGGHNQKLCKLLNIDYLNIGTCLEFGHFHSYYDGYHHAIYLGIFFINWGGRPYIDI